MSDPAAFDAWSDWLDVQNDMATTAIQSPEDLAAAEAAQNGLTDEAAAWSAEAAAEQSVDDTSADMDVNLADASYDVSYE